MLIFVCFTGHCKVNIVNCKAERGGGVMWPTSGEKIVSKNRGCKWNLNLKDVCLWFLGL